MAKCALRGAFLYDKTTIRNTFAYPALLNITYIIFSSFHWRECSPVAEGTECARTDTIKIQNLLSLITSSLLHFHCKNRAMLADCIKFCFVAYFFL